MRMTPRARGVLRRLDRGRVEQTPAPTAQNAVYGPALPDESTVHLVLDLALRIGEVQMASGAGAADVTATILAVTNAYGMPHCEVDVIFTSITISCHRGTDAAPVTALRVVRSRSMDYTRLCDVETLLRRITNNALPAHDAHSDLSKITTAQHPFPRWVATLAFAGMAASIALLVGGSWPLAELAAAITGIIDRIGRVLNRRALPFFFQQIVGGGLAVGSVIALVGVNALPSNTAPSAAIAAAVVVLLSGLSVVGAAQDAVTGYNVTAAGRATEIALMTAGLVVGVVLALRVGAEFNVAAPSGAADTTGVAKLPVQTIAGAGAALFFAVASYAPPRVLIVAAPAGALGALTYAGIFLTGLNPILASGIAATVVGFAGQIVSRRLRIPPLVLAVSGIVPLLPGLSTYRSMYLLAVDNNPTGGLTTLVSALGISLALGAGVVLGEFLAQPVRTGLGRLERKLAGPRLSGPLRPAKRRLE